MCALFKPDHHSASRSLLNPCSLPQLFLLIQLLLPNSHSFGQGLDAPYNAARVALEAGNDVAYKRALAALRNASPGEQDRAECLVHALEGRRLSDAMDYAAALPRSTEAETCARRLFGPYSAQHLDALTWLSWNKGYAGDLDGELAISWELLHHYEKDPAANALRIADTYSVIGMNHGFRGDHATEQRYLNEGLRVLRVHPPAGAADEAAHAKQEWTLLNSLAVSASDAQQYANARLAAQRCLVLLERTMPGSPYRAIAHQILARSAWCLDADIDACLHHIDAAIAIIAGPGAPGVRSPAWRSYMSYKAEYQLQAGRPQEALATTEQAVRGITAASFAVPAEGESAFKLLLNQGAALLALGRTDEAERTADRLRAALPALSMHRTVLTMKWSALALALHEQRGDAAGAAALMDSLVTRFDLLRGEQDDQVGANAYNKAFIQALTRFGEHHVRAAARAKADDARRSELARAVRLLRQAFRMDLANHAVFFTSGVDDDLAPDELDPAALLLEAYAQCTGSLADLAPITDVAAVFRDAKAQLLNRQFVEEQLFARVLPPDAERERLLLRGRVFSAIDQYLNATTEAHAAAVLDARTAYDALLDQLRERHPALRLPAAMGGGCDAQRVAKAERSTILDQYVGRDALYVLCTTPTEQRLVRRPLPADLRARIDHFRRTALDPARWTATEASVVARDRAQWRALLIDGLWTQGTGIERLVVIPHKELSLVNVELLPAFGNGHRYLIEEVEVRQVFSAGLLCAEPRPAMAHARFTGFSATDFGKANDMDSTVGGLVTRGGLFALQGTEEETEAIAQLFNGRHFRHATAPEFRAHADSCEILHVGTHGFADLDQAGNSFLLFEGSNAWHDRVTRAQVAAMQLDARLVVLSACNTGLGRLRGNEGAASLTRAFLQAGCGSVVSSLWQVPDAATREIMTGLYAQLAEGERPAAALREAKLAYLAAHPDGVEAEPFQWAGFVLYGMDAPVIRIPWYRTRTAALITAIVLLLVAAWAYSSMRRRRSLAR